MDQQRFVVLILALWVSAILAACGSNDAKSSTKWRNSDGSLRSRAFGEVAGAKDGEHVTLTDWIDEKYLCLDVTESQREVCTTALTRTNPDNTYSSLEIKLRVCSPEHRINCIVWNAPPYQLTFGTSSFMTIPAHR